MKASEFLVLGLAASAMSVSGETLTWAHATADMGAASSYVEGRAPQSEDVVRIPGNVENPVNPYLFSDLTIKGLIIGGTGTSDLQDCAGLSISGDDGCTLTLAGSGDRAYALSGYGSGEVSIGVPIVLSGGTPCLCAAGVDFSFTQAIATYYAYAQKVVFNTEGQSASTHGSVTLRVACPNFKPDPLSLAKAIAFNVADPKAISEVASIVSGNTSSGGETCFGNLTGAPLVLDKLLSIGADGRSEGFHFTGSPFVMTNCEFALSMAQSKARYADTEVRLRRIKAVDGSGEWFCKKGSDAWISLERTFEEPEIVNHLEVMDGLYYCVDGYPSDRMIHVGYTYDTGNLFRPTLGLDCDTDLTLGYAGGCLYFGSSKAEGKNGGFSAMAREVNLRLLDQDGSMPILTNTWKCTENDKTFCKTPESWVFGHAASRGTIVLKNDVVIKTNQFRSEIPTYVYQGLEKVPAVRFVGAFEATRDTIDLHGNGAAAFETKMMTGSVLAGKNAVGGGVFANCDMDTIEWKAEGESSYIGGTGIVRKVSLNGAGSALRGGEFGKGTLTVDSSSSAFTLKSGRGLVVDVAADGRVGCVKLKGSKDFKAEGGNFIRVTADPNLMGNGRGKILDWSEATGSVSMGDIGKYTVEVEEGCGLQGATVYAGDDGKSLWVAYSKPMPGFIIVIK